MPLEGDKNYPYLGFIDYNDITRFTSRQMQPLLEEWRRLHASGWMRNTPPDGSPYDRESAFDEFEAVLLRCQESHTRLVFWGD